MFRKMNIKSRVQA